MRQSRPSRPVRSLVPAALLVAALTVLLLSVPAGAAQTSKTVAKQMPIAALGRNALTTTKGRTLYTLSAETNGRFVCVGACLSTWHPLLVPAGTKPLGPVKLGTVERPDGRAQVTFKGRPLYSFSGDTKPGEAQGEGFKDVGTWHAAVTSKLAPAPEAPQPQPPSPYPYPY